MVHFQKGFMKRLKPGKCSVIELRGKFCLQRVRLEGGVIDGMPLNGMICQRKQHIQASTEAYFENIYFTRNAAGLVQPSFNTGWNWVATQK